MLNFQALSDNCKRVCKSCLHIMLDGHFQMCEASNFTLMTLAQAPFLSLVTLQENELILQALQYLPSLAPLFVLITLKIKPLKSNCLCLSYFGGQRFGCVNGLPSSFLGYFRGWVCRLYKWLIFLLFSHCTILISGMLMST